MIKAPSGICATTAPEIEDANIHNRWPWVVQNGQASLINDDSTGCFYRK